jgi:hypothetical protein
MNTTFRKLDLFPSSGKGGGKKTPTQLGPLERANLIEKVSVEGLTRACVCVCMTARAHALVEGEGRGRGGEDLHCNSNIKGTASDTIA